MNGRKLFRFFKPVLTVLIWFYSILPNFIIQFFWDISSLFSGKLFVGLRYVLLKAKAGSVGDNVYIGKYMVIKNIKHLQIGNNVSIHDYCYIDAEGGISIGNDVSIAHNTSILSADHSWDDIEIPIKYNPLKLKPTVIKDNVWIGCGVRILGGVVINSRTIIAAGAVVNKDVAANVLAGGVPVKDIKSI